MSRIRPNRLRVSRSAAVLAALSLARLSAALRAQNITLATTAEVLGRLRSAAPPENASSIWVIRRDSPPVYVRNPQVWTDGWDITGKAVWNSHTGTFGTTAISPRHAVYAHHVNGLFPVGTIVRFVTADDRVVERQVIASAQIDGGDIDLSTFDRALPPEIHPFAVMPPRWFLHCSRSAPGQPGGLPGIILDGNTQRVLVQDLVAFAIDGFRTALPVDPLRRRFTGNLRVGDSGSPLFVAVGGELVLVGLFQTAVSGPELSDHLPTLAAAMVPAGFAPRVADLSRFVRGTAESRVLQLCAPRHGA